MLVKSQVKYIQSLGHKKFRDADGVFVAEGSKIVLELLQAGHIELIQLYAVKEWLLKNKILLAGRIDPVEIESQELERISFLTTPNQVIAIFRKPVFPAEEEPEGITLLLDNIQDPGNLGTLVRTADWFDVRRIVCSPDTANLFNPKVVQSTMGSIARVEVLYDDLKEYIVAHPGTPCYAAELDGEDLEQTLHIPRIMLLIGNESRGIYQDLSALAIRRIRIPRRGSAESLNVAVAAGIILFMIRKA
jgi:TrmH family RNA methyltransferase